MRPPGTCFASTATSTHPRRRRSPSSPFWAARPMASPSPSWPPATTDPSPRANGCCARCARSASLWSTDSGRCPTPPFMAAMDGEAIDTMVAQASDRPTPQCHLVIEQLGGEVSRLDADATAFAHRQRPYNLLILGTAADRAHLDACTRWTRQCWEAMQPSVADGV